MAERRMFAKGIVTSARFLMLPMSARLLYYDLGMMADDDGVVEAFTVIRLSGLREEDLYTLEGKGLIKILNDELVTYICDWNRNNFIRSDRSAPSAYGELLTKNGLNQEKNDGIPPDNQAEGTRDTQDRIGKDRLGKGRLGKVRLGEGRKGDRSTASVSRSENAAEPPPPPKKEPDSFCESASPSADTGEDRPDDELSSLIAQGVSESYIKSRLCRAEDFARAHKRSVLSVLGEWWEADKDEFSANEINSSFDTDDFFNAAVRRAMNLAHPENINPTGG